MKSAAVETVKMGLMLISAVAANKCFGSRVIVEVVPVQNLNI